MSKPFSKNFWLFLLVSLAAGLTAGILGTTIARIYINGGASSTYYPSEINLSHLNANNSGLVIQDAKKVVVNQDVKITETINNIKPVLVGIFKEIPVGKSGSVTPDYYKLDEPLFIGLIITADGWVAAPLPADLKGDFKFKNYVAITSDRQVYKLDKLAARKEATDDLLIFHLTGASSLSVKKIVPRSELTLGQTLLVVKNFSTVWPTTLDSLVKTSGILSSDRLQAKISLAQPTEQKLNNAFVFNLAGDLVALINPLEQVIPAFTYDLAWQSLVRQNPVVRPYLGVNYLDLSVAKVPTLNFNKGALLISPTNTPAVIKDSPAAQAGLRAGDIITWVNNQELNSSNDLADLLANFQAGDKITLTYWRTNEEKVSEIKLGELKYEN